MICAVYISWLDGHGNWSPVHTRCIDVKDGDIERAARVLAKSFGKLKGFFITENDKVEFKVDDDGTLYWICVKPIDVEEI